MGKFGSIIDSILKPAAPSPPDKAYHLISTELFQFILLFVLLLSKKFVPKQFKIWLIYSYKLVIKNNLKLLSKQFIIKEIKYS